MHQMHSSSSFSRNNNDVAMKKKKKEELAKITSFCTYNIMCIFAMQSVQHLYLDWAMSTVKKRLRVSHLMSIFRKRDTGQFMYRSRVPNENVWRATKVHFMQCQNNIIAFCLFVNLTWLNHNTGTHIRYKGAKTWKKNKIHMHNPIEAENVDVLSNRTR